MKKSICSAIGMLLVASTVFAQVIKNPSNAEFTASVDHAQLTKYIIGFFLAGAVDPVQTADLGKPTPDVSNVIKVSINVMPLTFGAAYTAKVKAIAGTAESVWSDASNPFDRAPGQPSKPVIK
jgi:hypothetical protein